ncbi:hypothetical protein BD560DRAFT_417296 [Blakeslea trispora]|nr:hypothetical protein BD560DRAFT_417296 [Blakeslea trispora]
MWSFSLTIAIGHCPNFKKYFSSLIHHRLRDWVSSNVAISLPHLQEMLFIHLLSIHY